MDEREFFNRLENIDFEAGEAPGHRRRLRAALLKAHSGQKTYQNPLLSIMEGVVNMLNSRQPVWRAMLVSALVIGSVAAVVITRPSVAWQAEEEQAATILQEDSAFTAAFGGEAITDVKMLGQGQNPAKFAVSSATAHFIVDIDLATEAVVSYNGNREGFTEAEKSQSLQILNQNSLTQTILGEGAAVQYVLVSCASYPHYHSAFAQPIEVIAWVNLELDAPIVFNLDGVILEESRFCVWVDLTNQALAPVEYANYACMTDAELMEILGILRAYPETKALLDDGAVFVDVADLKERAVVNANTSVTATQEKTASIILRLGDKYYQADVDIVARQVTWFGEVAQP